MKTFGSILIVSLLLASFSLKANKDESWYIYLDLGPSKVQYSGVLKETLDNLDDAYSDSKALAATFTLGFYWPLEGHKTALGFTLNSVADVHSYKDHNTYATANGVFSISSTMTSFSALHFFTNKIGQGLFLKGDLGFGSFRFRVEDEAGTDYESSSDLGYGISAAGGYAFSVSEETRLHFSASASYRKASKNNYDYEAKVLSVMFGAIF